MIMPVDKNKLHQYPKERVSLDQFISHFLGMSFIIIAFNQEQRFILPYIIGFGIFYGVGRFIHGYIVARRTALSGNLPHPQDVAKSN